MSNLDQKNSPKVSNSEVLPPELNDKRLLEDMKRTLERERLREPRKPPPVDPGFDLPLPQPNPRQSGSTITPESLANLTNKVTETEKRELEKNHLFVASKAGMPVTVKSNVTGAQLANAGITISMENGQQVIKCGSDPKNWLSINDGKTQNVYITKDGSHYKITAVNRDPNRPNSPEYKQEKYYNSKAGLMYWTK